MTDPEFREDFLLFISMRMHMIMSNIRSNRIPCPMNTGTRYSIYKWELARDMAVYLLILRRLADDYDVEYRRRRGRERDLDRHGH